MRFDKQTIFWTAAILVVAACFLLFIAKPQLERMNELTALFKSEQTKQALNKSSLQSVSKLREEVKTLGAQTAGYDARIPKEEMLGAFVAELARCAQARNLETINIEPGKLLKSSEVEALPIEFSLRGSFLDVFALVQDIERMPRLTLVEQFRNEDRPGQPR